MDIQALLDAVSIKHPVIDWDGDIPDDFQAICAKLVRQDRQFFDDFFIESVAEMHENGMDFIFDCVKTIANDVHMLGLFNGDSPLDRKTRNTYAISIAMNSGHAMGRILESYDKDIEVYVKSSAHIWWGDLRGYIYDMEQRHTNEALVRDGEL
jgi:hypothetical protein